MAFVSIIEMRKNTSGDKRCTGPSITITAHGTAYITRALYTDKKPSSIEMEVDIEGKMVRVKTGEGYQKKLTGRVRHTFNVPVFVRRKVLSEGEKSRRINLTKSDDGWWYGSYAEGANQ
ncbi:hypothetical protein [Klebsiella quasipneumoniae]|nr:hypothetical protein [Klebsiella quasipneumoniae]